MTAPSAPESATLRPLGIGEILDRAVTLYARNFTVFSLIVLALLLPFGALEYFIDKGNVQSYQQIIQVIQHPQSAKDQKQPVLSPGESLGVVGAFVLFALLAPITAGAIALAVWRMYNGEPADWRSCYAAVLPRAGHIIAAAICGAFIAFAAAFAGMFAAMLPIVIGALMFASAPAAAIALFVMSALLFIVMLLFVLVLTLCISFAFYAIAVEGLGFGGAIGQGFGRIFNRHEIGRATLICLSVGAINIGISILALSVELLLVWLLHSQFVDAAVQTIIALVQLTFVAILTSVYYLDVRVRREGLDVYAALDRLGTQTAT